MVLLISVTGFVTVKWFMDPKGLAHTLQESSCLTLFVYDYCHEIYQKRTVRVKLILV